MTQPIFPKTDLFFTTFIIFFLSVRSVSPAPQMAACPPLGAAVAVTPAAPASFPSPTTRRLVPRHPRRPMAVPPPPEPPPTAWTPSATCAGPRRPWCGASCARGRSSAWHVTTCTTDTQRGAPTPERYEATFTSRVDKLRNLKLNQNINSVRWGSSIFYSTFFPFSGPDPKHHGTRAAAPASERRGFQRGPHCPTQNQEQSRHAPEWEPLHSSCSGKDFHLDEKSDDSWESGPTATAAAITEHGWETVANTTRRWDHDILVQRQIEKPPRYPTEYFRSLKILQRPFLNKGT